MTNGVWFPIFGLETSKHLVCTHTMPCIMIGEGVCAHTQTYAMLACMKIDYESLNNNLCEILGTSKLAST